MHVSDINEAIVRDRIGEIEDAFRALVMWPHEDRIEGAETPFICEEMLKQVCKALRSDQNTLPGRVAEFIGEITKATPSTYERGAKHVSDNFARWSAIFAAAPSGEG